MDIFEKCSSFTYAKEAMAAGFYPYFIPLSENEGTEAVFQGHRLIMCGSNMLWSHHPSRGSSQQ
jgi:hypothetical protein